jgi:CheY-like chemotaxis protein
MGRILLIDDDRAFSGFLASYIRDSFPLLHVEICNNPVAALQRIKAGGYDLMLIDLEMPSMDGMKLLSSSRDVMPTSFMNSARWEPAWPYSTSSRPARRPYST